MGCQSHLESQLDVYPGTIEVRLTEHRTATWTINIEPYVEDLSVPLVFLKESMESQESSRSSPPFLSEIFLDKGYLSINYLFLENSSRILQNPQILRNFPLGMRKEWIM